MSQRNSWIPGPWRLLAVAVLAIIASTAGVIGLYAHQRTQAIEYVRSRGGAIDFDDAQYGRRTPTWLREVRMIRLLEGSDLRHCVALSEATDVQLQRFHDDEMRPIARFRQLNRLVLFDARATGSGMSSVSRCRRLQYIEIYGAERGDELLEPLVGLPLIQLTVSKSPITDAGLRYLAGMPLDSLVLFEAHITDAGLPELSKIPDLRELLLTNTNITDAGLKHLAGLSLKRLGLGGTKVTDAGLPELEKLPLTHLYLERTRVTGAGLVSLKGLPLETLDLSRTEVTAERVRALYGMKGLLLELSHPPFDEADRDELEAAGFNVLVDGLPEAGVAGAENGEVK